MTKHYHKNPRYITDKRFGQLKATLKELGDLGGIVHDLNSDEWIGGNQRIRAMALGGAEPVIIERYDPPNGQGTVAVGYFEVHGEQFKYRAVRWTERQCEKANVIANKAGGDWDWTILAEQFELSDLLDWGFDEKELLGDWSKEEPADDTYTKKIESPVYTPRGEKPAIADLFDTTKTEQLIADIDATDFPEDEKEFLRAAARRHTVFNYRNIADYYACSAPPVQVLMENSALVIIDFGRAIELGYVKLAEEIAQLYLKEYGNEA